MKKKLITLFANNPVLKRLSYTLIVILFTTVFILGFRYIPGHIGKLFYPKVTNSDLLWDYGVLISASVLSGGGLLLFLVRWIITGKFP